MGGILLAGLLLVCGVATAGAEPAGSAHFWPDTAAAPAALGSLTTPERATMPRWTAVHPQATLRILSDDDALLLAQDAAPSLLRDEAGFTAPGAIVSGPGGKRWLFTTENPNEARLKSQTGLLLGLGVVAVGALWAMPKDWTGWDQGVGPEDLPRRWWDHVSQWPEWDHNDWTYNYLGHPYCGGVYYQMARKSGYNERDGFVYSVMMSTFLWEYGVEAFAQRPSIQDLIVTPVGGWLYGEWAYRKEKTIISNEGRVMGSKFVGSLSRFLLDPVESIGRGINRLVGREWILIGGLMPPDPHPRSGSDGIGPIPGDPGLKLALHRSFQ